MDGQRATTSLVTVGELDPRGTSVTTWRRQARPVEVVLWGTEDGRYAWALRLRDGGGTIEQSVADSFRTAAQQAEGAERYHLSVDWLKTW